MHTKLKTALAGLALVGAACAMPVAAHAGGVVLLPGAVWTGFVKTPLPGPPPTYITQNVTGPGKITMGIGNSFAGEEGLPTSSPTLLPTLSVAAGGFDLAQFSGGSAVVTLTYYLEIVGPGSGLAPLVTAGGGKVSSFNGGLGYAELFLTTPGIGGSTAVVSRSGLTTVPGADGFAPLLPDNSLFTINYTKLFPINTPIQVLMIAGAETDFEFGPSQASALIDPQFSIDPSFTDAGLYSIVTSDGIGNGVVGGGSGGGGSVPEPSTWAMMLMGFGALGAVLRGRRRSTAAQAVSSWRAMP